MTNLEYWKKRFAEAKDGSELLETIGKMNAAHTRWCWELDTEQCVYAGCGECKAKWLDMEAGEIMEKTPRDFDNIAVSSDCAEEVRRDDYESETNEFVTEDIIRLEGEEYLYGDI